MRDFSQVPFITHIVLSTLRRIEAPVSTAHYCYNLIESFHKFNVTLKDNTITEVVGKTLLNCNQFCTGDSGKKRYMF